MGVGVLIALGVLAGTRGFIKIEKLIIVLFHLGIVLILIGGVITSIYEVEGFFEIKKGQSIDSIYIEDDVVHKLGHTIHLNNFTVSYYPNSKLIKAYETKISISEGNVLKKEGIIRVNQPLSYKGFSFYQYGYDQELPDQTLIQAVKDPGMPIVYAGFFLLLFGLIGSFKSVFMSYSAPMYSRAINISMLAIIFLCFLFVLAFFRRVAFPLVPALQSKWLIVHVGSCFVAYASFTFAFITGIISFARKTKRDFYICLTHRSICIGFLFLTIGIILGSLWGKSAWGHWWNWDPKETWALIGWSIYLVYFYSRLIQLKLKDTTVPKFAIVGLLLILFNYFGVTFLMKGLHSYG